jgi:hypothetical protein
MKTFYLLIPEVAGEIGEQSMLEYKNGMISHVQFLHYDFNGWLGDELLKQSPGCFIVTKSLATDLTSSKLTGCNFEDTLITKSDEFMELYPDKELPDFVRLVPTGTADIIGDVIQNWSGHDICLRNGLYLIVTKRAFDVLHMHDISHCEIREFD